MGSLQVGSTLRITSNLSVDGNKFVVDAATGDVTAAGRLDVGSTTTLRNNLSVNQNIPSNLS